MRNQKQKRNKWIGILLAIAIIVTMMPIVAFAEDDNVVSVVSETSAESVTETNEDEVSQDEKKDLETEESDTEANQIYEEQDIEETVTKTQMNEAEGQINITLNANNDKAYFLEYNQETGQDERVAVIETWIYEGENTAYIRTPSYSEEDGIYFKGWSKSINGDILDYDYKPEEGETFYAQWGKTAKYTFVVNNDLAYYEGDWNSDTEDYEHVQEKVVWEPEENTQIWKYTPKYNKEDRITFVGWSESVDGPCVVTQYGDPEGSYRPKDGATYYAQWKKTTKITLEPNYEDAYFHYYNDDQYEYEDSPTMDVWMQQGDCMYPDSYTTLLKYDPSKGKVCIGWSTEKNGEVIEDGFVPEDGTILYGQWGDGAKITFHANREDVSFNIDPDLYNYIDSSEIEVYVPAGKPVQFLGNWIPNYEIDDANIILFGGWMQKPNGDLIDEEMFSVTESTDLYAKWVRGHIVTFDSGEHGYLDYDEGEYYKVNDVYYEDGEYLDISSLDAPYPDDQYTFIGWYFDKTLTRKVPDKGFNVTENTTLYAGYSSASDAAVVNGVISKINALPANAGVQNEAAVKAARAAYNALTAQQKKLVSQTILSKLTTAETQVANAIKKANEKKSTEEKQAAYNKAVSTAKTLKVSNPKTKVQKKKKAKVTWKSVKGASGYQIQYSLKKNFKKAKSITAKGKAKKATLKKLKASKKYFVRIRPFTNVTNVSGKKEKVYGAWSKTMKIKAKK